MKHGRHVEVRIHRCHVGCRGRAAEQYIARTLLCCATVCCLATHVGMKRCDVRRF
jgi:hypothetical protein